MAEQIVDELSETWEIINLTIHTGRVVRHFDLKCQLFKIYINKLSFFKKYILGYKNYSYRLDVICKEPLKGNKYKFPEDVKLTGKHCIENNFSIEFNDIRRNNEPDLSRTALNYRIQTEIYSRLKLNNRR